MTTGEQPAAADAAVVPAAMLEKLRNDPMLVFPDANTVVLGSNELSRMKQSSVILSEADKARLGRETERQRAQRQAKALQRKERMIALEEARKKKAPALSDIELEAQRERDALVNRAKTAVDEQHEDVKRMNQMVLYAKCVAIRDKQLAEKQRMKEEMKEQERLLDTMMEFERQNEIKRLRQRDRERVAEQKQGASVIVRQMQEREKTRLREQELKMQEGVALLRQKQQRERDEELQRLQRHENGRRLLDEIVKANQDQTREKARRAQKEIEEDLKIAAYIRERERREAEYEEQQKLVASIRDKEKAKLVEARQKDNDQQMEIDALRARRAHEESERRWRRQQKDAALKQQRTQRELAAARELQRLEKERKMGEQAREERQQFERMLAALRAEQQADDERERAERQRRADYSRTLKQQIGEIEARRRQQRVGGGGGGGEGTSGERDAELRKLEQLKKDKLAELENLGVPAKYRAELARFKLLQTHMD